MKARIKELISKLTNKRPMETHIQIHGQKDRKEKRKRTVENQPNTQTMW